MVQSDSLTNRSQTQLQPTEEDTLFTLYYQDFSMSDLIPLQTLLHEAVIVTFQDECTVNLVCDGQVQVRLVRRSHQPQPAYVSPTQPLTRRERAVLKLLEQGLYNGEIGQALAISEKTVEKHVSNILRKFQTKTRTQLVRLLVEQNI
jgi:DNA-binding NarL/FixJ family response regulator